MVAVLLAFGDVEGTARDAAPSIPSAVFADWALQDGLQFEKNFDPAAILKPIDALGETGEALRRRYQALVNRAANAADPAWLALYREACLKRRAARLSPHRDRIRRIVFTKHFDLGGSHYAYTEALSDAQAERHFKPGSALCVLEMDGVFGEVRTLLHDPNGVIRDPDVSWDGGRILFSWKKSDRHDDFHLYEMNVADGKIRQLTCGKGVADYEGAYLPDGDIVFNSTRCVQIVDCWWTEVSNLYTCDKDGRFLRRLAFDQVHDNYPTVTSDGRVIYTRWDYNDRGQIFPQGLFQMNPDGTQQRALYGNSSYFPTTILHARAIPGSGKIVAILTGHHTHQRGELALIDPAAGREENAGVQLISPRRPTSAPRIDMYGQDGPQFQYPYPLSESAFLVTLDPVGSKNRQYKRPYAIYLVTADGGRELLAWDDAISCNQPVSLAPRRKPSMKPNDVDYRKRTGTFYIQDIYQGMGLWGTERGTIAQLRIVALDFRVAGIGSNHNRGAAGGALISTPIAVGNGAWDAKIVLGEATVHADGSAYFEVPARTPVYFQALDNRGRTVQTMRSWVTLQPGEAASCVGCHDSGNDAPPQIKRHTSIALREAPQKIVGDGEAPRGFSFRHEIQPILDDHCVKCHRDENARMGDAAEATDMAFSLLDLPVDDRVAKRRWNQAYVNLLGATGGENKAYIGRAGDMVRWHDVQAGPESLPPNRAGAIRSGLFDLLDNGHYEVKLTDGERRRIACWIDLLVPYCGDYDEANLWSDAEKAKYRKLMKKRRHWTDIESQNILKLIEHESGERVAPSWADKKKTASQ